MSFGNSGHQFTSYPRDKGKMTDAQRARYWIMRKNGYRAYVCLETAKYPNIRS